MEALIRYGRMVEDFEMKVAWLMKIANLLQFTESHRFCVYRDFAISPLQHKMLTYVYQPMIGGLAVSLYFTLYHELPSDQAGYSGLDHQRKLFLHLDLEQGERGRSHLIDLTTRLEAVGLLQTVRRHDLEEEEYRYEYRLIAPLSPNDFFQTDHLLWLLHDKIGRHLLMKLRTELWTDESHSLPQDEGEDISAAFFDLFRISPFASDPEMEQMIQEAAAARTLPAHDPYKSDMAKFTLDQILAGIPHFSENRKSIERLGDDPEQMIMLNFVAAKFNLDLTDLRWILDSSNLFDEHGQLHRQKFEEEARLIYLQREKRSDRRAILSGRKDEWTASSGAGSESKPGMNNKQVDAAYYLEIPAMLQKQFQDIQAYNQQLCNLPYTKVLELFFPQGIPPQVRETFLGLNTTYRLPDEVVNVLIHFIHMDNRLWEKFPIEGLASDMTGKQVHNYETAVEYVRNRIKRRELATAKAREAAARMPYRSRSGSGTGGSKQQKPRIPISQSKNGSSDRPTEAEIQEMLKLARKLDEKFK